MFRTSEANVLEATESQSSGGVNWTRQKPLPQYLHSPRGIVNYSF